MRNASPAGRLDPMQHRMLPLILFVAGASSAQDDYRLPPQAIVDLVDAAPSPSLSFAPGGEHALVIEDDALPSIAEVTRRMLRLAGLRIDPAANGRHGRSTSRGLLVRDLAGERVVRVPLAAGARLATTSWSHDGERFSFTLVTEAGTELWSAHVEDPGTPRRLSVRLSTVLGGPTWMPDGITLLAREVPEGRGPEPAEPSAPSGPNVQETSGATSPLRTYQDLLANPHDEALFEHYATTQLVLLSTADGSRTTVGRPALLSEVNPSPDGKLLLVERLHRPFSYSMPVWRFPHAIEVWDLAGSVQHTVADVPLGEGIPVEGVRTGPRNVGWKAGEPATLLWVEALDGGDPDVEVEERDRWMQLAAPFTAAPEELCRLAERAAGFTVLADPTRALVGEYDRDRRWTRTVLLDLARRDAAPTVVEDRSVRDRYGDPGSVLLRRDASGRAVPIQDGPWIFRAGAGASPEGLLPFLDRLDLETLATERLWRCAPGSHERVVELLDHGRFVTQHESPDDPPNYRLRTVGSAEFAALTSFPDPTPGLRGIHKELVTYARADGVPLSATLYLPAGHQEGRRLPLFVWAYPIEFNDPGTAGQVGASPWRFTRIGGSSHLALLTQGWAILDGATMPVIGDPETMNDSFLEQVVAAARAAVDFAVERGVADRERCAVGGHSYGAFMTANLLAHSDLFRAGVARSGAYNRSLTPFGFQSERRTFWEAPEAYFAVSPFMHADEIDEPLLLIHGELDDNSGTFPMQSQRLFQAIQGHGGTARLVMLPGESHGYRARESVLHVQAETVDWLERFVNDAETPRAIPARSR